MSYDDALQGVRMLDDAGFALKQCPVTCGRPTRMTKQAFSEVCAKHRKNDVSWAHGHEKKARPNYCEICKGRKIPAELEIVSLQQLLEVKPKKGAVVMRKKTICDGCGKDKSLSMCSGDLLCSSCAATAGAVSNRPEAVAKIAVKRNKADVLVNHLVDELGPQWLMTAVQSHLPEQVAVNIENDTLERIAKAVGYIGDDGDGLLDEVDELCRMNSDKFYKLQEIGKLVGCGCEDFGVTVEKVRIMADQAKAFLEEVVCNGCQDMGRVYAALGIEHGDDEQIEVILDSIGVLTATLDRYRQTAERLAAENTALANQVADLEYQSTVNGQVTSEIADLIGCSEAHPAELPARIAAAMVEGLIKVRHGKQRATSLDSHLLDLLQDYPAIGVERIAVLRESA